MFMFMLMENVHEQWSGSEVSKKVHSEKRQFLGSFHKFCLILFSDYNFCEFFMCVLCNFLYSDRKLKWKTRLQAVWFWVCFFSSVNMLRSGHHKKEIIFPSLIMTVSGHDSCARNQNLWPVRIYRLVFFHPSK